MIFLNICWLYDGGIKGKFIDLARNLTRNWLVSELLEVEFEIDIEQNVGASSGQHNFDIQSSCSNVKEHTPMWVQFISDLLIDSYPGLSIIC